MIHSSVLRIERGDLRDPLSLPDLLHERAPGDLIRWCVARADPTHLDVEISILEGLRLPTLPREDAHLPRSGRAIGINVVPTGVGCDVGGYAGDAAPATAVLAGVVDELIANPNAVNASNFVSLPSNLAYTEGSVVDLFCQGLVGLEPTPANRVGLLVEKSDSEHVDYILNLVNAVRAVHGVEVSDVVTTEEPVGARCVRMPSGAFSGGLDDPGALLEGCERLIRRGATALCLSTNVRDLPPLEYENHFSGRGPNPVGGAEAVLSHLVARYFMLPVAHAPMINFEASPVRERVVDPRGAAEHVSKSGLASTLIGLRKAPRPIPAQHARAIVPGDLLAVVAPASTLGGAPMIYAARRGLPVIAVRGNGTILNVTAERLGIGGVIEVDNYLEAAGALVALRCGISIESVLRPLASFTTAYSPQHLEPSRFAERDAPSMID